MYCSSIDYILVLPVAGDGQESSVLTEPLPNDLTSTNNPIPIVVNKID